MGETPPRELVNAGNAHDITLGGLGLGLEGSNLGI